MNHISSYTANSTRSPSFYTGARLVETRVDQVPSPVEEIVANHTASKPSSGLGMAYAVESMVTAFPLLVVDLVVTGGGLIMASQLIHAAQGYAPSSGIWLQLPVLLLLQAVMMFVHQLYPGAGVSPVAELRGIVRSTIFSLLCLSAVNVILGQLPRIEFLTFAVTGVCVSMLLPLARWTARQLCARTTWWGVRILLIGSRDDCLATYAQLSKKRSSGFVPVGYTCDPMDVDEFGFVDDRFLGFNSEAGRIARKHLAPVAAMVSPDDGVRRTDRLLFQFPSVVWIDFANAARNDVDMSNLPHVFTTRLNMPFLRFIPRLVKRGTDLVICVPLMLVLAIPMLVITCIIKLVSPGPALFGHTRIGQHGSTFHAWKFRTMVHDADGILQKYLADNPRAKAEWEKDHKLKNDPRVIGVIGHFLRKWSLDELPQLWNVFLGEMSLVGPRPIVYSEIARYSQGYLAYSHMMPGITGLWQISGRNNTSYATRVKLDEHYARNWSLWLDFWVLLKTPVVVVTRDGAY